MKNLWGRVTEWWAFNHVGILVVAAVLLFWALAIFLSGCGGIRSDCSDQALFCGNTYFRQTGQKTSIMFGSVTLKNGEQKLHAHAVGWLPDGKRAFLCQRGDCVYPCSPADGFAAVRGDMDWSDFVRAPFYWKGFSAVYGELSLEDFFRFSLASYPARRGKK